MTSNAELLKAYAMAKGRPETIAPTIQLRNEIVVQNLGLVVQAARKYRHKTYEPLKELVQIGCLGLLKGIDRYDASRGHQFSTYATPYIHGEISHYTDFFSVKTFSRRHEINRASTNP